MSTTGWIILSVVNLPIYFFLAWILFRDWAGFIECAKFWLTPDIFSAFQGQYWEDQWGEMKLWVWVIACAGCVFGEAHLIVKFLGLE